MKETCYTLTPLGKVQVAQAALDLQREKAEAFDELERMLTANGRYSIELDRVSWHGLPKELLAVKRTLSGVDGSHPTLLAAVKEARGKA